MELGGITIFWIFLSIVVGVIANARGRSGLGWCLLALVISPLLAVIIVALMPARSAPAPANATPAAPTRKTKRCPQCAEDIMAEALRCKHCGAEIPPAPEPIPETDEDAVVRFGIRRDAGQYIYGKYRYTQLADALTCARQEHGEA
jgi:hypothetical protein